MNINETIGCIELVMYILRPHPNHEKKKKHTQD